MNELFKKKYLKYKKKYILLKGGAGTFYLYVNGIAFYVDGNDIWNNHLKKIILDKILPHFTQIEIRYYDPLYYGQKKVSPQEVECYRELIEKPTEKATVNKYFQKKMNPTDTLHPSLNKNNHLILNFAGLNYRNMYDRLNILQLDDPPSNPIFLHIPYLIILSEEQLRSQSADSARQIVLFSDQLINNNYVGSSTDSWGFVYFYNDIIKNYQKYIDGVLRNGKDVSTRQTIVKIIDSIFLDANFRIKLYLAIYRMTSTIHKSSSVDGRTVVLEMLKQNLDPIFTRIDFSCLNQFNLPQNRVGLPPDPLPPFLNFDSLNFDSLKMIEKTYPDINPEILKLLCPYSIPDPTTTPAPTPALTPDRFLTLLVSSVY